MQNFGLIGAAGYIAERHMRAIKETGNNLTACLDKFDVMGRIDSYFPNADFFVEPERFDRHLDKKRRTANKIDFLSICSPNYMHDAHIRMALRNQADAICEKPLVLNPWNVDALEKIEEETGKNVYNVLQLRLHPSIIGLKKKIENEAPDKIHDVDLTYITSRGKWYFISWKGDMSKSGGIATNIGIHFFDMLTWIFGDVEKNVCHLYEGNKAAGFLQLKKARVRWFLSLDDNDLPANTVEKGMRTYRSITVEGQEVEFSGGFTDLHTKTYQNILAGKGFGLNDARKSIQITHDIRAEKPVGLKGDYHPFAANNL
ncbi:MAG: Gfo/Idh/MocA family oxidoreductase [Prolixibacteraceae bacterium]|nr:Gfo/Idh/MocA family oxidoreductase [Prolixibacteraceae bacterium]MBN2650701.1 Gfo/Idh/MocA family oxidoreductase [Prolixibacteraceae bacterium]